MRNKFSLLLFLLILSNDIVYGKHRNKTREKLEQRKQGALNNKLSNNRFKRSAKDEVDLQKVVEKRKYYSDPKLDKDPPFWGTRGRRDSSEEIENNFSPNKYLNYNPHHKLSMPNYNFKREDEEESPFWGNRGRRNSDESEEELFFNSDNKLNKERRQDDDPFWGTRGRREYIKDNKEHLKNYILNNDDYPFWGNRGRRQENEPFWGNRGRRDTEPFWESRERQKQINRMSTSDENEPFWGNRGRRRLKLKYSIIRALKEVKDNIDDLIEFGHNEDMIVGNRGIKNRYLVPKSRGKIHSNPESILKLVGNELVAKKSDHNTVHDDRIYAEEPHYILVERSSRSSAEFDPFFISRGKKDSKQDLPKMIPSRRGAIEDLVKSVRNDPYYIARGKKDIENIANVTSPADVSNSQNIFCFIVDQILSNNKGKRAETESSDRDRRTILKNLALKLQMDPYYVSRGKKEVFDNRENLYDHIVGECN